MCRSLFSGRCSERGGDGADHPRRLGHVVDGGRKFLLLCSRSEARFLCTGLRTSPPLMPKPPIRRKSHFLSITSPLLPVYQLQTEPSPSSGQGGMFSRRERLFKCIYLLKVCSELKAADVNVFYRVI